MSLEVEHFTIRPLTKFDEFDVLVDMQQRIAGIEPWEVYPKKLFKVVTQYGGAALCLFDSGNEPKGFAYYIPGRLNGELIGWSYLLIVDRDLRDIRWEKQLRNAQRECALNAGFTKLCWTIDPLDNSAAERNFCNFELEGIHYLPDFPDKSGLLLSKWPMPDRFILEWDLTREQASAETQRIVNSMDSEAWIIGIRENGFPADPDLSLNTPELFLPVPSDVISRTGNDPDYYCAWRLATRSAFSSYIDRGYRIVSYLADISPDKSCGAYLLKR